MDGFKEGYEFYSRNAGNFYGQSIGIEYVAKINDAIEELEKNINAFSGDSTGIDQLKGDIAEFWHGGTFNINAAIKDSDTIAIVDRSRELGSADITLSSGDLYGLKFYKNGGASAKAQSISVFERYKAYTAKGNDISFDEYLKIKGLSENTVANDPLYMGQNRLIPRDQMEEAINWLKRKIASEESTRPEQVERYKETLNLLTDRLKDSNGTESIPLSEQDSRKLAELGKDGAFKAEDFGLSTEELVHIKDILRKAYKAGLTSAVITTVLKIAPDIISAILFLIENGEIDSELFQKIGVDAITGAAEGFVRGTISAGLISACQTGMLGTVAKSFNPNAVGMAVVLVMDTLKKAYKVSTGKMSKREMTDEMVKESFICSVSMACGMGAQAILAEFPVLGFMLGSFVGSVVGGIAYTSGYKFMLSISIDTGFSFFGLVDQNYELPEEVLKEIGLDIFEPSRIELEKFEPSKFEPSRFTPTSFSQTKLYPYYLRRGVIGIREIGYV